MLHHFVILKGEKYPTWGVPTVMQWVRDLALLQLWGRLQLRLGFEPGPGNFQVPQVQPNKNKYK